jgi:peptidoglycan hydrolase-like protein with peptidoglycan-binding domain
VTLTEQQRTQIRQTVLADRSVPRVDRVDFSISVGTRVPTHVRVIEVPQVLIEIHPEWRGHRYFVVRDEIVIVDRELAIVAVVPVGGSSTEIDRPGPRGGMAAGEGSSGAAVSLSVEEIRQMQIVLKEKGFFRGEPDGVFGPQTRQALIVFQRQQGFQASGRIDSQTVTALGISTRQQGGAQPSTSGQGAGSGQQGNQSGSQPSTTGQGNPPAASGQGGDKPQQGAGAGQQGSGSQPSTTGQGNPPAGSSGQDSGKPQQSPGGQGAGAGQQGSQSGSQPSTSGQGNPPASSSQGSDPKK